MLGHLRRCPASLQLRLLPPTTLNPSRPLQLLLRNHAAPSYRSQPQPRAFHKSTFVSQQAAAVKPQEEPVEQSGGTNAAATDEPLTTFKQLGERGLIDQTVIRTLRASMGLETMTEVQSRTINEALKGTDVLAQAKTGTGKTIGFLLPIVQNILRQNPSLAGRRQRLTRSSASDIKALIISPTRELAEQIATEAKKVTKDTNIVVQTAVGGTQKQRHLRDMHRQGCHILVGTPGRLKDILSDPRAGVTTPGLDTLVLDEADRLLDLGFWPEIQEIQKYLPHRQERDRQTLMFSATVPRDIVTLARSVMKPSLHYVRTVQEDEQPTAQRVTQKLVVLPTLEHQLPAVLELCSRELKASQAPGSTQRPFKAIVYFNTTMETEVAADMFFTLKRGDIESLRAGAAPGAAHTIDLRGTRVYSIHSRLSQAQRTFAADNFRNAISGILMSSDVTARGMDFPNVTHIIQVGMPKDGRDTYIHRIGRTARAGQEGEGWLLVTKPNVQYLRKHIGDLPVTTDNSLETTVTAFEDEESGGRAMSEAGKAYFGALKSAALTVKPSLFSKAYMAMVSGAATAPSKSAFIAELNQLTKSIWGLKTPPSVSPSLVNKLGLSRVRGLNVGQRDDFDDFGSTFGGMGGMRNSGRDFDDRDGPRGFQGRDRSRGFQGGDRSRDFPPRDTFSPRNDGRDFPPRRTDNRFPPRRSERRSFEGSGRTFDREAWTPGQRSGSFDRGGFGGDRGRRMDLD